MFERPSLLRGEEQLTACGVASEDDVWMYPQQVVVDEFFVINNLMWSERDQVVPQLV